MSGLLAWCPHTYFGDTHVRHKMSLGLQTTKNAPPVFWFKWYVCTWASAAVCRCPTFRVHTVGVDTQVRPHMTFHPLCRLCVISQTALRAAGSSPLCQQPLVNIISWFCEKYNILFFLVNVIYCVSRDQTHGPGYARQTFCLQTRLPTFLLINLKPSPTKDCPFLHPGAYKGLFIFCILWL